MFGMPNTFKGETLIGSDKSGPTLIVFSVQGVLQKMSFMSIVEF